MLEQRPCGATFQHKAHEWWGVDTEIGEVRFHCKGKK